YAAMTRAHPEVYKRDDQFSISVRSMHDQINAQASTVLWLLFAASVLLFVIAASNVANLILARTVRREPELAVRSALGASTAALRRSLLAESLVLCGSGVAGALAIAAPMVSIIGKYAARFSVRTDDVHLDATLVWCGIGLALAASLFLAYVPRLPGSAAPASGRAGGGTRGASASNRRLRIFAVTQITASFLLLAGAGLLLHTLYDLESQAPPFDTSRVLAINLPPDSYGRTPQQQVEFNSEVVRQVSALPGVASASTAFSAPWRDGQELNISFAFAMDGAARKSGVDDPRANFRSVSPGYFSTIGLPILAGRDFRDSDRDGADRVVIISKSV